MKHPDEYRDMGVDEDRIQTEMMYEIAQQLDEMNYHLGALDLGDDR